MSPRCLLARHNWLHEAWSGDPGQRKKFFFSKFFEVKSQRVRWKCPAVGQEGEDKDVYWSGHTDVAHSLYVNFPKCSAQSISWLISWVIQIGYFGQQWQCILLRWHNYSNWWPCVFFKNQNLAAAWCDDHGPSAGLDLNLLTCGFDRQVLGWKVAV